MEPLLPPSVYSSITWLLVITSPSEVMIIPVPSSSLPFDFTSIETTAWMTLSTSCGMVTLPLSTAAPGAAPLSRMTGLPALFVLLSARAVTPAPTPPPMTAATSATGNQERKRPGAPGGAGGGGGGAIPGMVGSTGGGGYVKGLAGEAASMGGAAPGAAAASAGGVHGGGG